MLGLSHAERRLADALGGDRDALEALAADPDAAPLANRHRAAPALYLRAAHLGLGGPAMASWQRQVFAATARHLVLREALHKVAEVLGGIPWLPLKGFDLATRVYDAPEERITADLDLLIHRGDLRTARHALTHAGWHGVWPGPLYERYLAEEGYAWPAKGPDGVLLELHFRLWGAVPDDLPAALWQTAHVDHRLPPGGHRLTLTDAYLVAAVHVWLGPSPRPLAAFWDLARIAAHLAPEDATSIAARARLFGLELPLALAAEVSAELWGEELCRRLRTRLAPRLRWPERRLAAAWRRRGLVALPFARMQAARLLAGRRSRHGWRVVWRQLWPHPGIVEMSTPGGEGRPWPRRRLDHELRLVKRWLGK